MPRLTIDHREIEVSPGSTVLEAARAAGIDVPTLCHFEGCAPLPSCQVCIVMIDGRLSPSCGVRVREGMRVESESSEVFAARRTALELLLSDHAGDCLAPCERVCPAHMDIPEMLRQIAAGDLGAAIETIKADIALPGVLGYICPAPCEKGCRREAAGGAVSVCMLKRHAAEADLASGRPYVPPMAPPSGKRVAVVGAGPAGLAAAYHLAQLGHAVAIFDEHEAPGGALRYAVPESELPRSVLDEEIALIAAMGVAFHMGRRVGVEPALEALRREFDAVLLAVGPLAKGEADPLGLRREGGSLPAKARTHALPEPGLFAAGAAVRPGRMAVRSVAEGKAAAASIHRFLAGARDDPSPEKPLTISLGQLDPAEVAQMLAAADAEPAPRSAAPDLAAAGFTPDAARREASRCIHCDCRKVDDCRLRSYAQRYGANPTRFGAPRRQVALEHRPGGVIFERGKCIACGLCVRIAADAREPLGLAFIGRGFDVRPGVPFGGSFDEALTAAARACIAACPTGALAYADANPHPGRDSAAAQEAAP